MLNQNSLEEIAEIHNLLGNLKKEYHEGIIDFGKLFEGLRDTSFYNRTFNWLDYLSGSSTFSTWGGSPTTNAPSSPFSSSFSFF